MYKYTSTGGHSNNNKNNGSYDNGGWQFQQIHVCILWWLLKLLHFQYIFWCQQLHTTTWPRTAQQPSNPISPLPDNIAARWVKNLSCKPLTEAQIPLLLGNPVLLLCSDTFLKGTLYHAVEEVCLKLPTKAVESHSAQGGGNGGAGQTRLQ